MTDQTPTPFNLPAAFLANNFTPEQEEVYRHLFVALRREAEARPGLQMLRTMVAERAAHTFTRLKQFDQAERVYQPDYARAAKDLTQTVRNLLDSAKDADDDADVAVRQGVTAILDSILNAIESMQDDGLIDEAVREQLLQRTSDAIGRASIT